ncbi:UNVERIFIED_CONTAM: hypothetical protein HHA_450250 [Hammondia hammondi]|eukprot:XP_008889236.1 hypothetical protein HHA_450250 [Hammondia hammondi]
MQSQVLGLSCALIEAHEQLLKIKNSGKTSRASSASGSPYNRKMSAQKKGLGAKWHP